MHLLSLTLQQATAINVAIVGNFSAPKAQEFCVARGKTFELLRADPDTGKISSVVATECFGIIRSLHTFRLTGASKDFAVIGSDSGTIAIVEYDVPTNSFKQVHKETFGKSGCRRVTPGQYLAVDPKGRAIMIGAIEKQKLVYVMNRDASNRLTISSPLDAHKASTICFDMVGIDTAFENPVFACIELDYSDADSDPTGEAVTETEKSLTYYELDLGLNHVVRKWSEPIPITANKLIAVPGGTDGPGGVLICAENWIIYKTQDHDEVRTPIPRRLDMPDERGLLIVGYTAFKQRDFFFFLVQSEMGDLYKVTLEFHEKRVTDVVVKFFDTVPVGNSICITKNGYLFVASEFGNHVLYQFKGLGDDDDTVESRAIGDDDEDEAVFPTFTIRPLTNLEPHDELESLTPINDMKIADLQNEDAQQLYAACGRGPHSALRVLRHGLSIGEMAVSELPGNPVSVWTVKDSKEEQFDKYIVISFVNATLVLSIGESVEEVNDSGFLGTAPTMAVQLLADDTMLQVHSHGCRHIRSDKRINEWKTAGKKTIQKAAVNERQVIIALAGGGLIYFELDDAGQLEELTNQDLGVEIACLDLGQVPAGRIRSPFLVVGTWDKNVQILSLDPNNLLVQLSTMSLPGVAESLLLTSMSHTGGGSSDGTEGSAASSSEGLYLIVGLAQGVYQRTRIDTMTGALSDTRSRFLGSKPVKLFPVTVQHKSAVLALTTRPWLSYNYQSRHFVTPLSYESLDFASNFQSEQCNEGIVAISGNTLRIISIEKLGDLFNQQSLKLTYTPRRVVTHPNTNYLLAIETDHNEHPEPVREEIKAAVDNTIRDAGGDPDELIAEGAQVAPTRGPIPQGPGFWGSRISVIDTVDMNVLSYIELENNEAAFSIATCVFKDKGGEVFVVVGTAVGMTLHPRAHEGGQIHVYRMIEGGRKLIKVHSTQVEDVPLALCQYQGRLMAGVGKTLRIYELGKKKLLKKCENRQFPTFITKIVALGERVYVGDMQESVHFVKLNLTASDNQLVVYADDSIPRHMATFCMLDYDTICGSDKFGNVFVLRLPGDVTDDIDNPTGSKMLWDTGVLNGAPSKLEQVCQFHIGELVTSMQKTQLVPEGQEAIVYSTVMGSIGALIPFQSQEDIDFYTHLEMHMRSEYNTLLGRDVVNFRSYYLPVKNTIDGDFCEMYTRLPNDKQQRIADELDRTPGDVIKKLEDIRSRLM